MTEQEERSDINIIKQKNISQTKSTGEFNSVGLNTF